MIFDKTFLSYATRLRPRLLGLQGLLLLGSLLILAPVAHAQQPTPILSDPKLTPGAVLPVTKVDICVPGYTNKVRNVPKSVKDQVYAEYGITSHKAGDYEVDHLISLELGGSNSIKNLFPESYRTQPWNAHVKDKLENKLHALVCSSQLDLTTAQHAIATDWIRAYKKYMGTGVPVSKAAARRHVPRVLKTQGRKTAAPDSASPNAAKVWVNTKSGKYFRAGSRYYGKTKEGQYLSEDAAKQQRYTAAQGK